MNQPSSQILKGALTEVFEEFAFAFVDDDQASTASDDEEYVQAHMSFNGPTKGSLDLVVPASLSSELAANILVKEPEEVSGAEAEDAVKEVLNISCGKVCHGLFGDCSVIELSVPEVELVPSSRANQLEEDPGSVRMTVEDSPIVARMMVDAEDGD